MKPFLNRESDYFAYLYEKFPALSTEKLRARIFWWPSDTTFNAGQLFSTHHENSGKNAWRSFAAVVENFLRNLKALNYHDLSKQLLNSYKLGCHMSVKVHFLHSHVNYFSGSLEAWLKSKESPSTKILKQWRKDTRDAGIPTWWQTIAGAEKEFAGSNYSRKIQKRQFSIIFSHEKNSMLSCLGYSWHFNAFLSPQSLHCKAIISVYFLICFVSHSGKYTVHTNWSFVFVSTSAWFLRRTLPFIS